MAIRKKRTEKTSPSESAAAPPPVHADDAPTNGEPAERPSFDSESGELWFRGKLVKRLRESATVQVPVLQACEAARWARMTRAPNLGKNTRLRLKDAIRWLNEHQDYRCLVFGHYCRNEVHYIHWRELSASEQATTCLSPAYH